MIFRSKQAQAEATKQAAEDNLKVAQQAQKAAEQAKTKAEEKLKEIENKPLDVAVTEKIEQVFISLSKNLVDNIINEITSQNLFADNEATLRAVLKNNKIDVDKKMSSLGNLIKKQNLTKDEQSLQSNMTKNILDNEDVKNKLQNFMNAPANAILTSAVDNPSEASKLVLQALLDNNEKLTPKNIADAFAKLDKNNSDEAKAMMQVMIDKIENLKMAGLETWLEIGYDMTEALKTLVTVKNNIDFVENMITNASIKDAIKNNITNEYNTYHANEVLTSAVKIGRAHV